MRCDTGADTESPAVSVIIPIYNMERFLPQCLDSVLCQTLHQIEIICIDDGSHDHSFEILREYEKRDNRIIAVFGEHRGVAFSRNEGLRLSTGEFVAFMDPDDYYPSETSLTELYHPAKNHHALVCGGGLITVFENGRTIPAFGKGAFREEGFIKYREYQYPYFFQRFLFERDLLIQNNIVFPDYIRFQDVPFFIKAMIAAQRFYAIHSYVYCHREKYKKLFYTEENLTDILKALKDCLEISKNHDLHVLHALLTEIIYKDAYPFSKYLSADNKPFRDAFMSALNAIDYGLLDLVQIAPLSAYHNAQPP